MSPKRKRSPWFSLYVEDYLVGTMTMSLAAQGAYMRLLAYQFNRGAVPNNPREICRILGAVPDEWVGIREEVLAKFEERPEGLVNARMEREREEREINRNRSIENGKRGGRPPGGKPRQNPEENLDETRGLTQNKPRVKASTTTTTTVEEEGASKLAPSPPNGKQASRSAARDYRDEIRWAPESGFSGIDPNRLESWKKAYPALDLDSHVARAHEWLLANPNKAKRNPGRFLVGWLARAQEKGGDRSGSIPNRGPSGGRAMTGTAPRQLSNPEGYGGK